MTERLRRRFAWRTPPASASEVQLSQSPGISRVLTNMKHESMLEMKHESMWGMKYGMKHDAQVYALQGSHDTDVIVLEAIGDSYS
jgi:hypothetical protein